MNKRIIAITLGLSFLFSFSVQAQSELLGEKINIDFATKIEPDLLKKAADSKTSPYDFMLICKRLGVYGDQAAAAVVAKSLGDPAKSHSARTALEQMPFPEAVAELRKAVAVVTNPLLKAGIIDSLGMKKDRESMDLLKSFLKDKEQVVANAALFALARIADPAYCELFIAKLNECDSKQAKSVADLCLMYGEFLRMAGKNDVAEKVFSTVIAKGPSDFHKEAACFQIVQMNNEVSRKFAAQWLAEPDPVKFRAVLRASRFVRNNDMNEILSQAWKSANNERKPLILSAIGDQRNPKSQNLLLTALSSDDATIKEAAVLALRAFASPESLKGLVEAAVQGDAVIRKSSIAVIELLSEEVDGEIMKLFKSDEAHQALAVELVAVRRMKAGLANVFALAKSGPDFIRPTALKSLGYLAEQEQFSYLVDQSVTGSGTITEAAKAGLNTACGQIQDRSQASAKIAAKLDSLKGDKANRLFLCKALSLLGGAEARDIVEKLALSNDRDSCDIATEVLGGWMDIDVAPILLKLANTPGHPFANRSLRGTLRLARQFAMPDWLRCAIVRDALASPVCGGKEKEVVDRVIKQYKLDLNIPETNEQKILRNIEIRQAVFGAPDKTDLSFDVTDKVRDAFMSSGVITVTFNSNYNKYFGGDPAPGVPKRLKLTLKYRDSGKVHDLIVSENAKVILPVK